MLSSQESNNKIDSNTNLNGKQISINAKISAMSEINKNTKSKKRNIKYRFEELKRKQVKKSEEPVLRSIPQSQVQNTAFNTKRKDNELPKGLQPAHKTLRKVPSYKSKTSREEGDNIRKDRESDEMSEHVIWKYSPIYKGTPERSEGNSPDRDKDYVPNLVNPPSTPTVSNKLKSVLNFPYLNNTNDEIQPHGVIENVINEDNSSKRSEISLPKNLLRNIDDILNDMREDTNLSLNAAKLNQIPSSPATVDRTETLLLEEATKTVALQEKLSSDENKNDKKETSGEHNALITDNTKDIEGNQATGVKSNLNLTNSKSTMEKEDPLLKFRITRKDEIIVDKISVPVTVTTPAPTITTEIFYKPETSDKPNIIKVENEIENDDDDDEMLFDMISQQKPNPKYNREPDKEEPKTKEPQHEFSDEMLDDSLLDIFDEIETNEKPKPNDEAPVNLSKLKLSSDNEEDTSKKEHMKLAQCAVEQKGVIRLAVLSIREMTLPKIGTQKILTCIDGKGSTVPVILRNPWVYLEIYEGDVIHIIEGKNYSNKRLLSQDKDPITHAENDNILILHPDILLSATTLGSSTKCLRCSIIDNLFQDTRNDQNISMTIGNIVHELLQDAFRFKLSQQTISTEFFTERLDDLLDVYSFAILVCNETVEDVKNTIMEKHVNKMVEFVNRFVSFDNFSRYVPIADTKKNQPISISDIIDIEENIWSPSYGLKGFLDATVETYVENDHLIAPLEIKTGKYKSQAHEVQGLIYTLLLSDRYDINSDFFLLMYTWEGGMIKYRRLLDKIRHIIMTRNKVATALKSRLSEIKCQKITSLPVPKLEDNPSKCTYCFNKTASMILFKLLENGTTDNCRIPEEEYEQITDHLPQNITKYKNFFVKYSDLITKEESSVCASNQDLFLLDGKTRESKNGHCIPELKILKISEDEESPGRFLYEFRKKNGETQPYEPMSKSQIFIGDRVILSDENGHFSIASGSVIDMKDDLIVVSTKRKLLHNQISSKYNNGSKIESVIDPTINESEIISTQNTVTYRIDKYDIQQPLSGSRFNILNLFLPPIKKGMFIINEKTKEERLLKLSEGGDERMRRFLVDNEAPKFVKKDDKPLLHNYLPAENTFNIDQHNALDLCLRAKDYALVLGMPGTGKTTLIAELIKILVKNGKKILLTSYTHSAVDNILLKLLDADIKTIRLGSDRKIHPETQRYIPDYTSATTYQEFLSMINDTSLVATTCLGINDLLFTYKETDFDYVILDEASQVSMPVALGPLRFGEKFIMVGDHNQLPPLVKNERARTQGLEDSLFKILSERHPESMAELTLQYRMCEDIMKLSNFLIYKDKLKCGNEQVSNQSLTIQNLGEISKYKTTASGKDWLTDILDPSRKVVFGDYDRDLGLMENVEGDNIINRGECELICQMIDSLIVSGVSCERIGVMTLYRAQLKLLQSKLKSPRYKGLEVLTADQFQGRDKDCILISMVRSNNELKGGSLLKEVRRVNVAMTRAKSKLIIIGSKDTITSIGGIREFMGMLEHNGWIYKLPSDCLKTYNFANAVITDGKCTQPGPSG